MHTIDVDFDVFKELTVRRESEDVSYNDVIRKLLGLGLGKAKATGSSPNDWVAKGVQFPADTEFRANYKGQVRTGRIEGGALTVGGKRYESPSAAAQAITGSIVNGWHFWECRLPGKSTWQLIASLRR